MLRTATVAAAVWNLDQHLPLERKQIADFTLHPHFILLLARWKKKKASWQWCSFFCWLTTWQTGRALSSHRHSGRNSKRKVYASGNLGNSWDNSKQKYKIYQNLQRDLVCVCVCMHEYDSVPQWYCGQQFPAMVAWTRVRPGAQLTEDSGHRLTSQTAPTHGKKCKRDFWDTDMEAHMPSNRHAHHNSNEDSSCRCCWYPQPGFLRVNMLEWVQCTTRTLFRQKTQARKVRFAGTIVGTTMGNEGGVTGVKLTTQVGVAAGLFSSHLHQELIVPASGSGHGRACRGVTLWEGPVTAAFGESSQYKTTTPAFPIITTCYRLQ